MFVQHYISLFFMRMTLLTLLTRPSETEFGLVSTLRARGTRKHPLIATDVETHQNGPTNGTGFWRVSAVTRAASVVSSNSQGYRRPTWRQGQIRFGFFSAPVRSWLPPLLLQQQRICIIPKIVL